MTGSLFLDLLSGTWVLSRSTNPPANPAPSPRPLPALRPILTPSAGATACISCYPLDIIRTRLTITNAQPTARIGVGRIMGLLLDIVASDGLRGLYRGLTATLAVTMPTMGISFAVYGYAKAYLLKEGYRNERTGHLSAMGSLCAGSVSGKLLPAVLCSVVLCGVWCCCFYCLLAVAVCVLCSSTAL